MSEQPKSLVRRAAIPAAVVLVVAVVVTLVASSGPRGVPETAAPTATDAPVVDAAADASSEGGAETAAPSDEDPPTLAAAIARALPLMRDSPEGSSAGTLVLLGWSNRHLVWRDVAVDHDETSYELVQKAPAAQRGKRMCVAGTIERVNPVRTDSAIFYNGVLVGPRARPFAFLAVEATGALAENSPARLCGVVTGRVDVASAAGRPRHAVSLVGIFDLPENRAIRDR